MIVVIRAGGTGTRLWPVSRRSNPKQFSAITGDTSLIKRTFDRVLPLAGSPENVYISVHTDHAETVLREVPEMKRENIIVEMSSRNTGPAICLEVAFLEDRGVSKDEVVVTIPSDDFIGEEETWRNMMVSSETFLDENPEMIITPGAKPDYLDTGYSFITVGNELAEAGDIKFANIAAWDEKPNEDQAQQLLENARVYYHMGMYVWKLGNVSKRLEDVAGHVMNVCRKIIVSDEVKKNLEEYSAIPKESIESLLTKNCPSLVMVTAPSLGWSDIGKWHVVKHVLKSDDNGNVTKGDVYARETDNSLIYAPEGKPVAVIGLEDVVIVDTGDALLVSRADKSADVKKIVEQLEQDGKEHLL